MRHIEALEFGLYSVHVGWLIWLQGGDMMKQRAAERPQSLNIMRNAGNILTASTQSDTFLPAYSAGSTSGSGSSLPSQQVELQ